MPISMLKGSNLSADVSLLRPGIAASTTNIIALPGAFKFKEITSQKMTDLTDQSFSKTNRTTWIRG